MSNRLYNQFSYSPERQPISLMGKFVQTAAAVQASLTNQGLTYQAITLGAPGNSITIQLIDPVANGPLSIVVVGNAITITLAQAAGVVTTTASQLAAAFVGTPAAAALVNIGGGGASPLVALAITPLAGGIDPVIDSNAMNMSMTQTATGIYTIQLEDEFPELLSAQLTFLRATPDSAAPQVQSANTAFGTSKTVVVSTAGTDLVIGDGIFVHLVLRNSSNP